MAAWIPSVVCSCVIYAVGLSAQFYFKWVPEVESQKRHLKQALWVAYDVWLIGASITGVWFLSQYKGIVSAGYVLTVSFAACIVSLSILTVIARRLGLAKIITKLIELSRDQATIARDQVDLINRQSHALIAIVEDVNLSSETRQRVRDLFTSED